MKNDNEIFKKQIMALENAKEFINEAGGWENYYTKVLARDIPGNKKQKDGWIEWAESVQEELR